MRITKTEYYLKIAETVALRSTCLRRKYGAIIVKNDEIIAAGYNGSPRGEANCCDVGECYKATHETPISEVSAVHGGQYGSCVAVHAESNCLISAARRDTQGADLYLACIDKPVAAPCNCCDRMIRNAGIARVITGVDTV